MLAALQGEYNPFAFHLVHILTHVVNVWLMFALAKRLFQQTFAAGIAALFFAWYPLQLSDRDVGHLAAAAGHAVHAALGDFVF